MNLVRIHEFMNAESAAFFFPLLYFLGCFIYFCGQYYQFFLKKKKKPTLNK